MAMHHLPDTDHLQQCFDAIERVLAPEAKVFVLDFGRIKSLKSVEYFVGRAIPKDEPILEHDYRASLKAAFSREEFSKALSSRLKQCISIYSTVVSPVMVVLMTPFPEWPLGTNGKPNQFFKQLPHNRRADFWLLRLFLRLGGMPSK
jgi:hypothetical protein